MNDCKGLSLNDVKACIESKNMSAISMRKFKCHKEVDAMPMTRGEYNQVRGWEIPENENQNDTGMLVVYNKGTVDEYVSWSPWQIFADGYAKVPESWLDRVIEEKRELDEKIKKLGAFIDHKDFVNIDDDHAILIQEQFKLMVKYSLALEKRIELAN